MKNKEKIAILGFGLEGQALFSYLKKKDEVNIEIRDKNENIKLPKGTHAILGSRYLDNLGSFDVVYRSPGIPLNLPQLNKLSGNVSSLTRLFMSKKLGKVVGVTGSAGKTTTVSLIYKILRESGKRVNLAGNIGINPLPLLGKLSKRDITILELSSFQLQDLEISPEIAVILDIYDEHLDKHKTLSEYYSAKANISRFQERSDTVIYNLDNRRSQRASSYSKGKKYKFSLKNKNADIYVSENHIFHKKLGAIFPLSDFHLVGNHNLKNAMAAILAAIALGVKIKSIQKALKTFKGLPHRNEFVRELHGVNYFNDSKATNVGSAIEGINSIGGQKIVLSGGHNKNLNLGQLARRLAHPDVKFVIFFGQARRELSRHFKKSGKKNFKVALTLQGALKSAATLAKPGDTVALEPSTTSFDEFKNYEDRGNKFKRWVRELK